VTADGGQAFAAHTERHRRELHVHCYRMFLVALQVLPPRQRAALIAADVLDWSARETAAALAGNTVPSRTGAGRTGVRHGGHPGAR